MHGNQQLAQRQAGELAISQTPLKPQELCLLDELALTAENSKTEIGPELQAEFLRQFQEESPALIRRAFRVWRLRSNFTPTVAEFHQLLDDEAISLYQEREADNWEQLKGEMDEAREYWRGHPEAVADLKARCREIEQKLSLTKIPEIRQIDRRHPEYLCTQEEWEERKARAKEQARFLLSNISVRDAKALSQSAALGRPPKKQPKPLDGVMWKREAKAAKS